MAELDDEISRILCGVTSETILQDATKGEFAHVMKLKDCFLKSSPGIDNLLTAKCISKRNLIHWLAHHKKLEIMEWIRGKDPRSVSSSSGSQRRHWPTIALERKVSRKYFNVNAQDVYGFTALHLATWGGHEEIVKVLLAYDTWVDVDVAAENMHALDGNKEKLRNGQTALHIAAADGKFSIVKMLLDCLKDRMQDRVIEGRAEFREALSIKSTSGKTALHYAAEHGKWEVVKCLVEAMKLCGGADIVNNCDIFRQTPLYLAVSQQNAGVVEILLREGEGLKVNTVTWEGITPLDKAKKNEADRQKKKPSPKFFAKKTVVDCPTLDELKKEEITNQRIVDMLESYDVNWLHAERAKYANAANCLLVGAALIASITYAGWLQPPLGITQYYEFAISNAAAPPQSFESYVGVEQHPEIQLFWIFNSLSFFCSIATFIIGADAGIPQRCASLREEVVQLRQSTVRASFILSFAIIGVIGAFSVAGILVLPPIERQRAPTYVTVALGVIFCLYLLMRFMKKLWIWFRCPSLQFKLEKDHTSVELSPDVVLPKKRIPENGPPKQVTPNDGPPMPGSANFGPPKLGSIDSGPPEPESVDFGSPRSGSEDSVGPPLPRSVDLGPPKSGSIDLRPSKLGSADLVPPDLGSANWGPSTVGSADLKPPKSRNLDFGPPMTRNTNFGPPTQGSVDFRPFIPRSLDFGPPTSRSANFRPFILRSLDFGLSMLESADLEQSTPESANSGPPKPGSVDSIGPPKPGSADSVGPPKPGSVDSIGPPKPRSADSVGPPKPGSVDSIGPPKPGSADSVGPPKPGSADSVEPPSPKSVDFGSPMPRSADYGPFMLESAYSMPPMPKSANLGPLMLRNAYSGPPQQRHLNYRLLRRGRADILETSNSNALGKRKYDNICRPFEEQQQRRSFKRYASKT